MGDLCQEQALALFVYLPATFAKTCFSALDPGHPSFARCRNSYSYVSAVLCPTHSPWAVPLALLTAKMYTPHQDSVVETPLKRRKLDFYNSPGAQSFNSQDADADNLFIDLDAVDTIPTFPPRFHPSDSQLQTQNLSVSQHTYVTQPTQLLPNITLPTTPSRSRVQVPASSPDVFQNQTPASRQMPSLTGNSFSQNGQRKQTLGTSIAPPGTLFRAPQSIWARPSQATSTHSQGYRNPISPASQPKKNIDIINIDDDEEDIVYKGGFSDDESQNPRDIKPSVVKNRNVSAMHANGNAVAHQQNPASRFSGATSNFKFQDYTRPTGVSLPPDNIGSPTLLSDAQTAQKRSSDLMVSAYAGYERPAKQQRSSSVAQRQPEADLKIENFSDPNFRKKLERIRDILGPTKTIRQIKDALIAKRCNVEDATALLIENDPEPEEVDLTISDDEKKTKSSAVQPPRITTKQQLKQPAKKINEKYGLSSHAVDKAPTAPPIFSPNKDISYLKEPPTTPAQAPAPRKRLVQGRKHKSSPVKPSSPIAIDDDSNSDSGVDAKGESEDEGKLQDLLVFLNSCPASDIVDMANIKKPMAERLVSCRPFKTLNAVRAVTEPGHKTTKAKKEKRTLGDKVVDICWTMWKGYEAVDDIVRECKRLRKPITEGMKQWGVDVVGAAKDGEIDLVNLEGVSKSPSLRDSGIGTPTASDGDEDIQKPGKGKSALLPQPELMSKDISLKDYQVIGMNWLSLLFHNNLSCILADDMGLGKTCQVIAFLAHLYETQPPSYDSNDEEEYRPHLIVVPGSTLENWLREFETFCPSLPVTSYYGSQAERDGYQTEIKKKKPYVIVTTYTIAVQKSDRIFLKKLKLTCAIFDEGHELKNCKSNRYNHLMRINADFRLLLTGTPLQNNLTELMSLLNFIMPDTFAEHNEKLEVIFKHRAKTNEESHDALLSAQRIGKARSMMAPFILRRRKEQVLQNLPKKTSRVEYCELSPSQEVIYQEYLDKAKRVIAARQRAKETKEFVKESSNVLTDLRKACCHPLLFRRLYTDKELPKVVKAYLSNPTESHRSFDLCIEDMEVSSDHNIHRFCLTPAYAPYISKYSLDPEPFLNSGKVIKLIELLQQYKKNGDRALIFSQFVMVIDILEEVLTHENITFFRLDGATRVDDRQSLIDQFYADESVTAFMLSTKAGGAGINLAAANKVIIFDSSFNPQDDIQAENRAHRVGQRRDVEVIRLVTKGTIEEQIHALGESKVLLDARVAGGEEGKKAKEGERMVREALEREVFGAEKGDDKEKEEAAKDEKGESNKTYGVKKIEDEDGEETE